MADSNTYPEPLIRSRKPRLKKHLPLSKELEIFVKQMIYGRLFVGMYEERRYVEQLETYRDVVVIGDLETDLKRDLDIVKSRILMSFKNSWIGFTGANTVGAPVGHALWVKLQNIPYGLYWFQIKKVKFANDEVIAVLKCVRKASSFDESLKTEETDESTHAGLSSENVQTEHFFHFIQKVFVKDFINGATSVITLENTKNAIVFLLVLLLACLTGLLHLTRELGFFTLRLIREFSYLLHVLTPVFLGVIEFFSKCVGGFYLLIAMMWRERRNQTDLKPRFSSAPALTYRRRY